MKLEDLIDILGSQSVSLFLGAGSSLSAGGPTGGQLKKTISSIYFQKEELSFFKIMELIIRRNNSKRKEVEDRIRSILLSIGITEDHNYLFSLPWRSILTTNYDSLPDKINKTLDDSRYIKTIVRSDDEINPGRPDLLFCIKLLGDSTISYPNRGAMVLTETDHRQAYHIQSTFYKLFYDLATTGYIIYIGYSFQDELVFNILSDIQREISSFPWRGYAIIPNKPSKDICDRMSEFNIEWIEGTFEKFISECKKSHGTIPVSSLLKINPIVIHGIEISLDKEIETNIIQKFKYLNQSNFEGNSKPIDFVTGKDISFRPYTMNWDFIRKFKTIFNKSEFHSMYNVYEFFNSRKALDDSKNSIFVILGNAGSGKTVAARRICYEWYKNGNPVIFLDSLLLVDKLALLDLMDSIRRKYLEIFKNDSKNHLLPIRFLIVAENSSSVLRDLTNLKKFLVNNQKSADILIVERTSIFPIEKADSLDIDLIFELDDTISDSDKNNFFKHFNKFNLLHDQHVLLQYINNKDINSSFFALLYTSVKQTQQNLKNSVMKEYYALDNEAKMIYSTVAVLQSYDQEPYLSLISMVCDISSNTIEDMIKNGQLRDLIFLHGDNERFLRLRHKIVAEIVKDQVYLKAIDLKQILIKIISDITPNNVSSLNLLHSLLIQKIKGELDLRYLSNEDKIELFKTAIRNVVESRILYHHLAILYLDSKNSKECRFYIQKAYDCKNSYFSESKRNVLDTEARLELFKIRKSKNRGDIQSARDHLINAEDKFKEAQGSIYENPHSVRGQAETYLEMAMLASNELDQQQMLILCLAVCTNYNNFTHDSFNPNFDSLKLKTLTELNRFGFDTNNAKKIALVYHNGDGYAFLADNILEHNTNDSLRLINEGLSFDPKSNWLNTLKIRAIKKLFPNDLSTLEKALEEWKKNSNFENNIPLNFEFAKFKYIQGKEEEALKIFYDIASSTRTLNQINVIPENDLWKNESGPVEFIGKITTIPRQDEVGYVMVNFKIKNKVTVPYKSLKFTPQRNQDIRFFIGFTLKGPIAIEVRSMA